MKKTIRLTESDLHNIVRKILNEVYIGPGEFEDPETLLKNCCIGILKDLEAIKNGSENRKDKVATDHFLKHILENAEYIVRCAHELQKKDFNSNSIW